ncbi:unnamed protein product [Cochlearia groenlandica]
MDRDIDIAGLIKGRDDPWLDNTSREQATQALNHLSQFDQRALMFSAGALLRTHFSTKWRLLVALLLELIHDSVSSAPASLKLTTLEVLDNDFSLEHVPELVQQRFGTIIGDVLDSMVVPEGTDASMSRQIKEVRSHFHVNSPSRSPQAAEEGQKRLMRYMSSVANRSVVALRRA